MGRRRSGFLCKEETRNVGKDLPGGGVEEEVRVRVCRKIGILGK